jgi:hypothetical protein
MDVPQSRPPKRREPPSAHSRPRWEWRGWWPCWPRRPIARTHAGCRSCSSDGTSRRCSTCATSGCAGSDLPQVPAAQPRHPFNGGQCGCRAGTASASAGSTPWRLRRRHRLSRFHMRNSWRLRLDGTSGAGAAQGLSQIVHDALTSWRPDPTVALMCAPPLAPDALRQRLFAGRLSRMDERLRLAQPSRSRRGREMVMRDAGRMFRRIQGSFLQRKFHDDRK